MRELGSIAIAVSVLVGLVLWLVGNDTTEKKIAVGVAFVLVVGGMVTVASIVATCTVARVRDDRLDFFFCGMRTKSFALDGGITFDLHKIGRLEVLRIHRGPHSYVPSGALDKNALVELLRANGVAEQQAD